MLIGYVRVSKGEQNPELQFAALKAVGCERIFRDVESGAVDQRPALLEALAIARRDDVLVVWRLDRLGRSLKRLIAVIEDLNTRHVQLRTIDGPIIDTTTAAGKVFFYVSAIFAEVERDMNIERTKAGLAAARARGRKGGRRFRLSLDQMESVHTLVDAGASYAALADQFKVGKDTIRRAYDLVARSHRAVAKAKVAPSVSEARPPVLSNGAEALRQHVSRGDEPSPRAEVAAEIRRAQQPTPRKGERSRAAQRRAG